MGEFLHKFLRANYFVILGVTQVGVQVQGVFNPKSKADRALWSITDDAEDFLKKIETEIPTEKESTKTVIVKVSPAFNGLKIVFTNIRNPSSGHRALEAFLNALNSKAGEPNVALVRGALILNFLAAPRALPRPYSTKITFTYWSHAGDLIKVKKSQGFALVKVQPRNAKKTKKAVYYLHGGGFASGTAKSYLETGVMQRLAHELNAVVYLVDYRTTPEVLLTELFSDCVRGLDVILDVDKIAPKDLAIMGDSAGGALSLGITQFMSYRNQMPGASVQFSPWLSYTMEGDSYTKNVEFDKMLSLPVMKVFQDTLKLEEASLSFEHPDVENFSVDFITNDFTKLEKGPPIMVASSAKEILFSDSVGYVDKLVEVRKDENAEEASITFEIARYGPHVYPVMHEYAPEYNDALKRTVEFVKSCFQE